jgi:hypothetical protein
LQKASVIAAPVSARGRTIWMKPYIIPADPKNSQAGLSECRPGKAFHNRDEALNANGTKRLIPPRENPDLLPLPFERSLGHPPGLVRLGIP